MLGPDDLAHAAAARQVHAAERRQWVRDIFAAVPARDRNRALTGAGDSDRAKIEVAYWLAALARVERSPRLARAAARLLDGVGLQPAASVEAVEAVYRQGLQALRGYGTQDADYVRAVLRSAMTQTQGVQQRTDDQLPAFLTVPSALASDVVSGDARAKVQRRRRRRAAQRRAREKAERRRLVLLSAGVAGVVLLVAIARKAD